MEVESRESWGRWDWGLGCKFLWERSLGSVGTRKSCMMFYEGYVSCLSLSQDGSQIVRYLVMFSLRVLFQQLHRTIWIHPSYV